MSIRILTVKGAIDFFLVSGAFLVVYIPAVVALNVYSEWPYHEMLITSCLCSQGILNGFIYADFWGKITAKLNCRRNTEGGSSAPSNSSGEGRKRSFRINRKKKRPEDGSSEERPGFEDPSTTFMVKPVELEDEKEEGIDGPEENLAETTEGCFEPGTQQQDLAKWSSAKEA